MPVTCCLAVGSFGGWGTTTASIGSLQSATKSRHNQSMQRSLINFLSASNSRQTSRHHQATCHQSQATTPPRQSGDQQMCQQPNAALYSPPAQDPGKLSSPEISGPVAQDPSGRCSADQGETFNGWGCSLSRPVSSLYCLRVTTPHPGPPSPLCIPTAPQPPWTAQ